MVHRTPQPYGGSGDRQVEDLRVRFSEVRFSPEVHVHVNVTQGDQGSRPAGSSSSGASEAAGREGRSRPAVPIEIELASATPAVCSGRVYVVWFVPGREDLPGLHFGPGAYTGLCKSFPNERYETGNGVAWKAAKSYGEAWQIFADRWVRDGGAWPPRVFRWA